MSRSKPVTWNGITYPTFKHAVQALDVSAPTLRSRLRDGKTCDADLVRKKKFTTQFYFCGKPYRTKKELRRLVRQYVLTKPKTQTNKPKTRNASPNIGIPVSWNGIQYSSIRALANEINKPYGTVYDWVNKGYRCDADIGTKSYFYK